MISKERYEELKAQHDEGCKNNDYNKMIMMGSVEHKEMKEYESQFCKHNRIESLQGGQIDTCLDCGKTWG
jgi:hypothetical protein